MGAHSSKKLKISDKNTKNKYPEGGQLFVGYSYGCLLEYSMTRKQIVHDFGKILDDDISSMAKTPDNKS